MRTPKTSIPLSLYNTLGRKIEEFHPLKKGTVGLYTCGPTVYHFAHIGNLRTYAFNDILERVLRYNGYRVNRVMNITDVGHLTSDADEGEDKMERNAKTAKDVLAVARKYTKAFLADSKALNIVRPKTIAPATKFIKEQIVLAKTLEERRFAYETSQALYFDVTKLFDYGKLTGQTLADKSVGARDEVVADPEKHHPADFALWFKLTGRFANHLLRWPSPWGPGFPGWHIECSAIGEHVLGQPFDIHTGGVDHIGTHHTNEIAQSEAAYGKPLANIWMHGEHLVVNGAKMAKSAGSFYVLADIVEKGFHPLAFRYFVLGAHYRTQLNFTWDALRGAANALAGLRQSVTEIQYAHRFGKRSPTNRAQKALEETLAAGYAARFLEAVNNDLNLPQALAAMWEVLKTGTIGPVRKLDLLSRFDAVLGLDLVPPFTPPKTYRKALALKKEYEECRTNKQFTQSDALRKKIEALGYRVKDTTHGSLVLPA